jgi:hypothetical protein
MSVELVLNSGLGLVVAPAGCGKTHLIANTLNTSQIKPYLVLTHTTAGVTALKQRLKSIPAKNYVVTTIDGWALKIAKYFPSLCPIKSRPEQGKVFYPELRQQVLELLRTGQINDLIQASYSRLLVDEYQDCDLKQHNLVQTLSTVLPTVVFGDPMQCIFNFGGPMPDWSKDVETYYPLLMTLESPWRWRNAEAPVLGDWILQCRKTLFEENKVDLNSCPTHINYRVLTGDSTIDMKNQQSVHYSLIKAHPKDTILVIGDSKRPSVGHKFAQRTTSLDVVEPVDFAVVTCAAAQFDKTVGMNLIRCILDTASTMMTNVEIPKTLQRINTIQSGKNRTPPTFTEHLLLRLVQNYSRENILEAFVTIEEKSGVRIYRKSAFYALKDAILLSMAFPDQSLYEAATKVREQRRRLGDKRISRRAIGSTLLLKGLECDHVIILDAGSMNSNNLYVALSRGAKSITVFAQSNLAGGG